MKVATYAALTNREAIPAESSIVTNRHGAPRKGANETAVLDHVGILRNVVNVSAQAGAGDNRIHVRAIFPGSGQRRRPQDRDH